MNNTVQPLPDTTNLSAPRGDKRKADVISPHDDLVKRFKQESNVVDLRSPENSDRKLHSIRPRKDAPSFAGRTSLVIDLTEDIVESDSPEEQEERKDSITSGPSLPTPISIELQETMDREPDLCPEQRDLVYLIVNGANVFYTGSAGCGKSTVLKAAVRQLRAEGKRVQIVAPTGRAALDIGGQTLHSFAGLTPDSLKMPLNKLREKAHGKILNKRFKLTEVLIIDEISMVENHFLERLNEMIKEARGNNEAFGGMQVVVLGDFYQCKLFKFLLRL
jgi:hypothetical protein